MNVVNPAGRAYRTKMRVGCTPRSRSLVTSRVVQTFRASLCPGRVFLHSGGKGAMRTHPSVMSCGTESAPIAGEGLRSRLTFNDGVVDAGASEGGGTLARDTDGAGALGGANTSNVLTRGGGSEGEGRRVRGIAGGDSLRRFVGGGKWPRNVSVEVEDLLRSDNRRSDAEASVLVAFVGFECVRKLRGVPSDEDALLLPALETLSIAGLLAAGLACSELQVSELEMLACPRPLR